MGKTLNPVGWGYTEDAFSASERARLLPLAQAWFGGVMEDAVAPLPVDDIALDASRLKVPDALRGTVVVDPVSRVLHARGRSFPDLTDLRQQHLKHAPDAVATPRDEVELVQVLDWCDQQGAAVIPFGGGSSVVGGVTPEVGDGWPAVVTLSLRGMCDVLEVDNRSACVHAQAGILGPALEAALKPYKMAVRHFPQSYHHSTLGGWVATRGAGHFSTQFAKIEDRVQAVNVVLPDGRSARTTRLPAGSIGVDPNRLWCGSEGTLGIITSVWLRCMREPTVRDGCGIQFPRFEDALEAARAMLQAGIFPTQLRVLDPFEHMLSRAMAGHSAKGALMVLAFESAGAPLSSQLSAAQELAAQHNGTLQEAQAERGDAVGDWKNTFFRQPYMRDAMLDNAVITDTFETAVTWSELPAAYNGIRDAVRKVLESNGGGAVTCRVTHAYPDGCCLYFAFFTPGRRDALRTQWQTIRDAAAEVVTRFGGTASHHHAMGRMHRGYARDELPAPFIDALHGAKARLDPKGVLNPGLLPDA